MRLTACVACAGVGLGPWTLSLCSEVMCVKYTYAALSSCTEDRDAQEEAPPPSLVTGILCPFFL